MAIPLVGLSVQTPDIGNAFLTGVYNGEDRQAAQAKMQADAQKSQIEARAAKLGQLSNMAFAISRIQDRNQRAAALDRGKQAIASMYGNDPETMRALAGVTVDNIEGYATALTGIKEHLDAGKTDAEIANIYNTMGNRDANTSSMINDRAARTGIYGSGVANANANRDRNTSDQIANRGARTTAYAGAPGIQLPERPLPPTLAKQEQADVEVIGAASAAVQDMDGLIGKLQSGAIELGPMTNFESQFRNWTGESTPNSRAYTEIQSVIEKIRNATLMLNKGVQTEGDAQRALNEIAASTNDVQVLVQQLSNLREINRRALELRKNSINLRRQNAGFGTIDASGYEARGTPYGVQPPPDDDIDSLIDQYAPQ